MGASPFTSPLLTTHFSLLLSPFTIDDSTVVVICLLEDYYLLCYFTDVTQDNSKGMYWGRYGRGGTKLLNIIYVFV